MSLLKYFAATAMWSLTKMGLFAGAAGVAADTVSQGYSTKMIRNFFADAIRPEDPELKNSVTGKFLTSLADSIDEKEKPTAGLSASQSGSEKPEEDKGFDIGHLGEQLAKYGPVGLVTFLLCKFAFGQGMASSFTIATVAAGLLANMDWSKMMPEVGPQIASTVGVDMDHQPK